MAGHTPHLLLPPRALTRATRFGLRLLGVGGSHPRQTLARCDREVTDAQTASLGKPARRLAQRIRNLPPSPRPAKDDKRLLRLDWAVRAGETVLADRAGPFRALPDVGAAPGGAPTPQVRQ